MFKRDNSEPTPRPGSVVVVPLLPLRDVIVYPTMMVPLFVGREKSINALNAATTGDNRILLAAQRKAKVQEPTEEDIFDVGTLATVVHPLRLPDGTIKVLVEGKSRAKIKRVIKSGDYFQVEVELLEEPPCNSPKVEALLRSAKSAFEDYAKLNRRIPPEMLANMANQQSPGPLADTLVAHLNLRIKNKQEILETIDPQKRLERLCELIQAEIQILQVEKKIRSRVKKQMEKNQKEYYLNEQMQAIQKELGEKDEFRSEMEELEERLRNKSMPDEARLRTRKELKKLKMMSPMSAEATVVRNYIDWLLSLPWDEKSVEHLDIDDAKAILDEDHYGLRPIKERILEYLAVRSLVDDLQGPILCFAGPPGVGKTSLAKSIARATGREFMRISLGGVRDEAEIRGHRRTYIGAMPGKLIQSLKRAGTSNPLILLDEVDKMSSDFRGDPAAALLEVLDPEQNTTFSDHYLDLDYNLGDVMFIATANDLQGIPLPLKDRLEIITLAGYTEQEKASIARRYLIPKQLTANGLTEKNISFTNKAIFTIVRRYTREAGVRNLDRQIASVCRKVAKRVVQSGKDTSVVANDARVLRFLGVPKFKHGQIEENDEIGFANGLAYTTVGGEIVPIEATVMPGKGKLILTGKLGTVFQESAHAALSYIRARSSAFGLEPDFYQHLDIHIHVPIWGVDGPSAGITICLSMVSALIQIPVRRDIAMTGEISLRGRVLPIGGVREKLLAAHRSGIQKVLVPGENEKDLEKVPSRILKKLDLTIVHHMDEVLLKALSLEDPEMFFKRLIRAANTLPNRSEGPPLGREEVDAPLMSQ